MAMIDDVIVWANTLPAWQGDVVRRLLLAGEHPLTAQDYSEILALAKAELKLCQPPDGLKPLPPAPGKFTALAPAELSVKLLSIDDVRNVNIIKPGQTQLFAENGITVVFGDNGSGKSGYSRVLKLACEACDKNERILPNVFAQSQVGTPSATLNITEGVVTKPLTWTQSTPSDPVLTKITVTSRVDEWKSTSDRGGSCRRSTSRSDYGNSPGPIARALKSGKCRCIISCPS
jgi:hypothetical protein